MQPEFYVQPVIDANKATHLPGRRQSEIREPEGPGPDKVHLGIPRPAGTIADLELPAYAGQLNFHTSFDALCLDAEGRHLLQAHEQDLQLRVLMVFQCLLELSRHDAVAAVEIRDIDAENTPQRHGGGYRPGLFHRNDRIRTRVFNHPAAEPIDIRAPCNTECARLLHQPSDLLPVGRCHGCTCEVRRFPGK